MEHFQTIVSLPAGNGNIRLNHQFLTLGSCFSDAIGIRLNENKFPTLVNPFGVIYNPISLHNVMGHAMAGTKPAEFTYCNNNDVFFNYDVHSRFSELREADIRQGVDKAISDAGGWMKKVNFLLLTYGTAWVYTLKEHNHIVANCHKMPARLFDKRLLSAAEIVRSFMQVYEMIQRVNNDMRIILTVSPVRHLKDSLPLNSVSKAVLRTACHELATTFERVEYFPAYEIMMDELRDYRFYKADMIHPTEQAEDYIWARFAAHYMDGAARDFIDQWRKIQAALRHKPFHPSSHGHKIFLKDTLRKLEELQSIVNVDEEMGAVKRQLEDHST
jgi:hypothetical protein